MSTNFYIRQADGNREHIGKRSAGWAFTFEATNHKTVASWRRRLNGLGERELIEDEYSREMSVEEFWQQAYATLQPWGPEGKAPLFLSDGPDNWKDGGFAFSNYEFE